MKAPDPMLPLKNTDCSMVGEKGIVERLVVVVWRGVGDEDDGEEATVSCGGPCFLVKEAYGGTKGKDSVIVHLTAVNS